MLKIDMDQDSFLTLTLKYVAHFGSDIIIRVWQHWFPLPTWWFLTLWMGAGSHGNYDGERKD